jgi:hypothetical protein
VPVSSESVGNTAPIVLATIVAGTTISPYTSGPKMLEAKRMTKWVFQLGGTFTGMSAVIYGTTDIGTSGWIGYGPTPTGANWFQLPAEAVQSGTGTVVNPLTAVNQTLTYDRQLVAVQVVVTQTSATGTCLVYGYAVK